MMVKVDLEDEYRRHVRALSHYASVLVGPDEAMDEFRAISKLVK